MLLWYYCTYLFDIHVVMLYMSCLSGLGVICLVCLGCLSFLPTSFIASVLCTCISMYLAVLISLYTYTHVVVFSVPPNILQLLAWIMRVYPPS